MDPSLIDQIYEAALVPEKWPKILNAIARIAGPSAASIFLTTPDVTAWSASDFAYEATRKFVAEGWFWRGDLVRLTHAKRHAGFLREIDVMSEEEFRHEPIYLDMWSHLGIGWAAATVMPVRPGEHLTLVLTRWMDSGPFEAETVAKLDALRPHLARSALMASRFNFERARAAAEALALIGFAAAVLDETGKVLGANALIEGLAAAVDWRAGDRLALRDRAANKFLRESLSAIAHDDGVNVRSFPVRCGADGALMVAHVVPIRRSARDIFARCSAVLMLAPVSKPQAPPDGIVQSLFDLTPSEARVAGQLVTGDSVEDIALASRVSVSTVRTHVRGVLEKTGCDRQAQVVALLGGLARAPR